MRILVVGDAMIDEYEYYRSTRTSPEGDHPVVILESKSQRPGGAAAVAEMTKALGLETTLIGSLGRWPRPLKRRVFIDGGLVFREDIETPIPPSKRPDVLERIQMMMPDGLDVVLVADYGKGMVFREVIELLVSKYPRVVVDPSRYADHTKYPGAWAICPNREEEEHALYGRCAYFHRVAEKRDRDGVRIHGTKVRCTDIPSCCDSVVDVCGAGDQFLAGVGVALVLGGSFMSAAKFGNLLAGVKCQKRGATPVKLEEVEDSLPPALQFLYNSGVYEGKS